MNDTLIVPTSLTDLAPGRRFNLFGEIVTVVSPAKTQAGRPARYVQFEDGRFATVARMQGHDGFHLYVDLDDEEIRDQTHILNRLAHGHVAFRRLMIWTDSRGRLHASWVVDVHARACSCDRPLNPELASVSFGHLAKCILEPYATKGSADIVFGDCVAGIGEHFGRFFEDVNGAQVVSCDGLVSGTLADAWIGMAVVITKRGRQEIAWNRLRFQHPERLPA